MFAYETIRSTWHCSGSTVRKKLHPAAWADNVQVACTLANCAPRERLVSSYLYLGSKTRFKNAQLRSSTTWITTDSRWPWDPQRTAGAVSTLSPKLYTSKDPLRGELHVVTLLENGGTHGIGAEGAGVQWYTVVDTYGGMESSQTTALTMGALCRWSTHESTGFTATCLCLAWYPKIPHLIHAALDRNSPGSEKNPAMTIHTIGAKPRRRQSGGLRSGGREGAG